MTEQLWGHRPPPVTGSGSRTIWDAAPGTPAELTAHRVRLRALLLEPSTTHTLTAEDLDRLLLAFEELSSNGLRHGCPPVRVTVAATCTGWVLDVTDAATDLPPVPAVGRDAAEGGMGLYLIAQLATAHGWDAADGRKHVWACIDAQPEAQ
jgi:two-component sensor histidine kinase